MLALRETLWLGFLLFRIEDLQHRLRNELIARLIEMHSVARQHSFVAIFFVVLLEVINERFTKVAQRQLQFFGDLAADVGILV